MHRHHRRGRRRRDTACCARGRLRLDPISRVLHGTYTAGGGGPSMRSILKDVAGLWDTQGRDFCLTIALSDVQLAVLAVHVACRPVDDLHARVAAA
jgi:hypothetical protein